MHHDCFSSRQPTNNQGSCRVVNGNMSYANIAGHVSACAFTALPTSADSCNVSAWGFVTARSAGTQHAEAGTRRGTKRHGRSPSAGRAAHTRKKATRRSGDATRDEALRAKPERRTRRAHAQHEKAGTRRGTKRYGRSPRGGRAVHTRTTPRRGRAAGRSVTGEAHAEDAARPRQRRTNSRRTNNSKLPDFHLIASLNFFLSMLYFFFSMLYFFLQLACFLRRAGAAAGGATGRRGRLRPRKPEAPNAGDATKGSGPSR